jgi:adenine-specific DNA-methyltransferase
LKNNGSGGNKLSSNSAPRIEVAKEVPELLSNEIEQLRAIFPQVFVEGKVDFERLQNALGGAVDRSQERFTFSWAGRRNSIQILQMPTRATLVPIKEKSVDFETTRNIVIEGDNLEVLKLLYKPYFGKVKMIYIDPPYNTGNEFVYPDNYSDPLDTYLKVTGQRNSDGTLLTSNPEVSGRYHSAWLTMMYPRLFQAKQLLSEEGVIFVSIDDHELPNLRLIMDEVFGPECFKNCIIFRRGPKSVQAQFETIDSLASGHEYVLLYSKNPEKRFRNFYVELDEKRGGAWNNHWRGTDRPTMRYELLGTKPKSGQWRWGKARSLEAIKNYELLCKELRIKKGSFPTDDAVDEWWEEKRAKTGEELDLLRVSRSGKPEHYIQPTMGKVGNDMWIAISPRGSAELKALFGYVAFDNPKPVDLIRRMLEWVTEPKESAVILDFFAGSCTTAHAVVELNHEDGGNRRFIMVQLQEPLPDDDPNRKHGHHTIADVGEERIRKVIHEIKNANNGNASVDRVESEDLGFKVFQLAESNYRSWRGVDEKTPENYAAEMQLHTDPLVRNWKELNVIYEVAIKEGYSLNSKIELERKIKENRVWRITDSEMQQSLLICLDDNLKPSTLKNLDLSKDQTFVTRDIAIDDSSAANLALMCRLKTL